MVRLHRPTASGWQGQFYVARLAGSVLRWPGDICESSATDYGGADVRTGLSADAARPMHRAETTGANCPPLARSLRRPVRAVGRRPRGARVLPRHLGGPHLNLVQAGRASYPLHFGVVNVRGDGVLMMKKVRSRRYQKWAGKVAIRAESRPHFSLKRLNRATMLMICVPPFPLPARPQSTCADVCAGL